MAATPRLLSACPAPPRVFVQKRTWPEFESHFEAAGLTDFVAYNRKKLYEVHCQVRGQAVRWCPAVGYRQEGTRTGVGRAGEVTRWRLEWGSMAHRCPPSPAVCPRACIACWPADCHPAFSARRVFGLQELGDTVQGMVAEDPPPAATAVVAEVNARKAEWGLEDGDVAKVAAGRGAGSAAAGAAAASRTAAAAPAAAAAAASRLLTAC